ncbi:MAG: hypothetical protein JWN52_4973 [Actinomycetia bacterium]|nr:hypothetical protein [Actinomycetes bacterium]
MRFRLLAAAVALVTVIPAAPAVADAGHPPLAPANLTVDDQTRPLAVEAPAFGWSPRDTLTFTATAR